MTTFQTKIDDVVRGGFLTLGLGLGYKLDLFKAMCELDKPSTSHQIAEWSGCKERYVREWLFMMVSGEIIEMTKSGEDFLFHLPLDHREALGCGGTQYKASSITKASQVPLLGPSFLQMLNVFKKDGPNGLDFAVNRDALNCVAEEKAKYMPGLLSVLISQVTGLENMFGSGVSCIDVGGGQGGVIISLAKQFPRSTFVNLDLCPESTRKGQEKADGLTNVQFISGDSTKMPQSWADQFDYAFMIDALHEMSLPQEAAAELFRVLKPGGRVSVLEKAYDSDPEITTKMMSAQIDYCRSLLHCLPAALNQGPDGLGILAGHQTITAILQQAGFVVQKKPDLGTLCHLLAQKPI